MGAKPNDVFGVHFAEPFAVVANLGFVAIENLEYLVEVSPRVGVHLVAGQRWSCLRNAGRIANHRGKIANQKDRGVAQILKMRSEEHTSELQSHSDLVCRLLLEKKKTQNT